LHQPPRRILFPFVGDAVARTTLDAALRLARAEGATLVPVYVATLPLDKALENAAPEAHERARPTLELIEQRARRLKVPVEPRVEVGRTARHVLHELIGREPTDRIVVPAATTSSDGFSPEDVGWLLDQGSEEIVVLRPEIGPAPDQPSSRSR